MLVIIINVEISSQIYLKKRTHAYSRTRMNATCVPHRLDDFSSPQPAFLSFALPEIPTFGLADLTYTSCSPSAILFLSGRAVHGRKHGRMPPHMGQTMADTRGPCSLFARSCFDEVGSSDHTML